jgi:diguanylate cyclase (GGDEF)-like protein
MTDQLRQWLLRRSRRGHLAVGLTMLLLVILLKLAAGSNVGFAAVALLPVAYLTWFVSRRAGVIASVAAATGLFLSNSLMLHRYATAGIDFWNASMDLLVFLSVSWSLSETKRQYVRVQQLAREDPLTGLLNRRAFIDAMRLEIRRAQRQHTSITLAYIDLDNFKALNDARGHGAGDRCLKAVASTLRRSIRDTDLAARLGGDEFAVLLTAATVAAPTVLADVANAVRNVDNGACPRTSLSVGAATFTNPGDDPQALLQAADDLLYRAKHEGKNRLVHELR